MMHWYYWSNSHVVQRYLSFAIVQREPPRIDSQMWRCRRRSVVDGGVNALGVYCCCSLARCVCSLWCIVGDRTALNHCPACSIHQTNDCFCYAAPLLFSTSAAAHLHCSLFLFPPPLQSKNTHHFRCLECVLRGRLGERAEEKKKRMISIKRLNDASLH